MRRKTFAHLWSSSLIKYQRCFYLFIITSSLGVALEDSKAQLSPDSLIGPPLQADRQPEGDHHESERVSSSDRPVVNVEVSKDQIPRYVDRPSSIKTEGPSRRPTMLPSSLRRVNRRFHEALSHPIESERAALGPAIFFDRNTLKLIKNSKVIGEERAAPTKLYHQVKAYSHMCMTVVIKLWRLRDHREQKVWAKDYLKEVIAAQGSVQSLKLDTPIAARQIALSALTVTLLEEVLSQEVNRARIKGYIRDIKPLILDNFEIAAQDHIKQLDRAFDRLRVLLSDKERAQLIAFTYGRRGPRKDNLVTQYLAYLVGQDRLVEGERVSYFEGISSADEGFDLLAKYNIEQAVGVLFFEDPLSLQRDVLADQARSILKQRTKRVLTESPSQRLLQEFLIKER